MFLQRNTFRPVLQLAALLTGCCLTFGIMTSSVHSNEIVSQGQLALYFELPEKNEDEVILRIDSIAVKSSNSSISFIPIQGEISSLKNSNEQFRLVDSYLKSGLYSSIIIYYNEISGYIGRAKVITGNPDLGQLIEYEFMVNDDMCTFINIRWDVHQIDSEAKIYTPQLVISTDPTDVHGNFLFVSNEGSDNLTIINQQTYRTSNVISTGKQPRGLAYSQFDTQLYVCNSGSDNISVIDVLTQEIVNNISLQFGDQPSRILLSPDNDLLYVLNYGSNTLSVINAISYQEDFRINVGENPIGLAINDSTGYVYISNSYSNKILIYDPVSRGIISSLTSVSSAQELLFSSQLHYLFIADENRPLVQPYNEITGSFNSSYNLCSVVTGMEINSYGDKLFIAQRDCREISVYHIETSQEINRFALDNTPGLITLDFDNRFLFVTYPKSNQLALININSGKIIKKVNVGKKPFMALVPW